MVQYMSSLFRSIHVGISMQTNNAKPNIIYTTKPHTLPKKVVGA